MFRIFMLMCLLISLSFASVAAQEVTDTPAPVITATAIPVEGPVVIQEPVDGWTPETVFVGFVIVYLLLRGFIDAYREKNVGKLFDNYKAILERQDVLLTAHQRYSESSVQIKDAVDLFHSAVTVISGLELPVVDDFLDEGEEFLDEVTKKNDELQE